jgi:hypothetical protein
VVADASADFLDRVQKEMDDVQAGIAASLAKAMYESPFPPGPPPPKRSRWQRLKWRIETLHWRARERVARAVYPYFPTDGEEG